MKRLVLLAVAVAAIALVLPLAVFATMLPPGGPTVLDQATAEADATAGSGSGASDAQPSPDSFTATQVSPATIAAEDGVSLATVDGDTSGSGSAAGTKAAARTAAAALVTNVLCWSVEDDSTMATWWGIPPYETNIAEHRHWCAHPGGAITYYSTSVHPNSNWSVCTWSDQYDELYSGGTGKTWVTRTTGANFFCPVLGISFLPGFHLNRWQRWSTNSWGTVSLIARSPNAIG